ncbi:LiaF domain-containing protein [Asanoa sp. NPDC049573]|uniref:LiaF domain-containing protein n=1 Tax=Asanoa sp. NPDC049573 TaxID=3155396 RepID=UPI00341997AB
METNESPVRWHVSLIGGLKRRGAWRVSRHMVAVSVIGGVNADLTEAEFVTTDPILTKVSLVGGVSLTVPHDVDVEVGGFQVFGGSRIEQARRTGPATRTLHVRNYGLFGGVRAERAVATPHLRGTA